MPDKPKGSTVTIGGKTYVSNGTTLVPTSGRSSGGSSSGSSSGSSGSSSGSSGSGSSSQTTTPSSPKIIGTYNGQAGAYDTRTNTFTNNQGVGYSIPQSSFNPATSGSSSESSGSVTQGTSTQNGVVFTTISSGGSSGGNRTTTITNGITGQSTSSPLITAAYVAQNQSAINTVKEASGGQMNTAQAVQKVQQLQSRGVDISQARIPTASINNPFVGEEMAINGQINNLQAIYGGRELSSQEFFQAQKDYKNLQNRIDKYNKNISYTPLNIKEEKKIILNGQNGYSDLGRTPSSGTEAVLNILPKPTNGDFASMLGVATGTNQVSGRSNDTLGLIDNSKTYVNESKTVSSGEIIAGAVGNAVNAPSNFLTGIWDAGLEAQKGKNIFEIPKTGTPLDIATGYTNYQTGTIVKVGQVAGAEIDLIGGILGKQAAYNYESQMSLGRNIIGLGDISRSDYKRDLIIGETTGVIAANTIPYFLAPEIVGLKSVIDITQSKNLGEAGLSILIGSATTGGIRLFGAGSKAVPLFLNEGKTAVNLTKNAGEVLQFESTLANVTGKGLSAVNKYGVPAAGVVFTGLGSIPIYQAALSGDKVGAKESLREMKVMLAGFGIGGSITGKAVGQIEKPIGKYIMKQTYLQGAASKEIYANSTVDEVLGLITMSEKGIPANLKPTKEINFLNQEAIQALPKGRKLEGAKIIESKSIKAKTKLQGSAIYSAYGVKIGRVSGDFDYAQAPKSFVEGIFKEFKSSNLAPKGTKPSFEQEVMPKLGYKYHAAFKGKNGKVAYELVNASQEPKMYKTFYQNQNVGGVFDTPSSSFRKTPLGQEILGLKFQVQENVYGAIMKGRVKDLESIRAVRDQLPDVLKAQPQQVPKKNVFKEIFDNAKAKSNKVNKDKIWESFVKEKPTQGKRASKVYDDVLGTKSESYYPKVKSNYYYKNPVDYYTKGYSTKTRTYNPTQRTPTPKYYDPFKQVLGTPTPIQKPRTRTPTPNPYGYKYPYPTPPEPTKTPNPTQNPYDYYLPTTKIIPNGFGDGSGGGEKKGSATREKRVYYNELEQVLGILSGKKRK